MSRVKVSIIIPTRNRPNKLIRTLSALTEQSVDPSEFEIIVVDDGSSPPVVASPSRGVTRCRYLRQEGLGRSAARNRGADIADGELLLFVDDDIRVGRDFIAAHSGVHQEWPGALVVGSIHFSDEVLRTPFGRFRHALEQNEVPPQRGLAVKRNLCTAANMSISRSSFEALEGFDRSLASAEDQDFALRFTDAGGRIAFAPEAAGLHDDDALDIRSYCRRVESGTEQLVAFCRRHPDWPENVERERVNGPLSPLSEPPSQSFRKVLKLAVGSRAVKSLVFGIASLLERRSPNGRALELTYRLLIGSHILRGYRRGLIRHAALSNELPVQRVGKQAAAVLQAADKR